MLHNATPTTNLAWKVSTLDDGSRAFISTIGDTVDCLTYDPQAASGNVTYVPCGPDSNGIRWTVSENDDQTKTIKPVADPTLCLTRTSKWVVKAEPCDAPLDPGQTRHWNFREPN
ncbi:hypothetical protein ACIQUL_18310 [Streptomyces sp. NPDC090303]|uniref:hypothetical protein n=1 Tax=Streptomyces sp. NPDC090303 TaxID=3365960 RepID=UPI00380CF964